jgi:hypothetical protein
MECEHSDDGGSYECNYCHEYSCLLCTANAYEGGISCKQCLIWKVDYLDVDRFYWVGTFYKRVVRLKWPAKEENK